MPKCWTDLNTNSSVIVKSTFSYFELRKRSTATLELELKVDTGLGQKMSFWIGSCNSLKISYLAAECAKILWVLSDFHLFDGFTEGSTITGSIFTNNSDLLGAFSLENLTRENFKIQIHHNYHGRSNRKSFTNTYPFNLDVFE